MEDEDNNNNNQQQSQSIILSPLFHRHPLPSCKEESEADMIFALEMASTASTDTDSSLSVSDDQQQEQQELSVVDLESPFGKLRHRTAETTTLHKQQQPPSEDSDDDVFLIKDDSDSEHGLLPRRRRKTNAITFAAAITKRQMFYGLVVFVAISSVLSLRSTYAPSRIHNEEWRHFKMHTLPMVKKALKKYQPEQEYTVVLRGGRLDLLQQSIDNIARCSSVKQVQVDYYHQSLDGSSSDVPFTLLLHESRKIVPVSNNLSTSAVFLLSEGIMISCNDMEKGFQAWRKDPRRLVGFLGYKATEEDAKSLDDLQHVVPGTGSFAFVSDRAMFVHKQYLNALSSSNNGERHGCCDVSLSAQVSAAFEKAPVVVKAKVVDLLEGSMEGARHQVGLCDEQCIPSWLQINDWSTIPHESTAILG